MSKTFAILAGLGVAALLAGTARNQAPDPQALAAELARLEGLTVPVGGVILWWGLERDIPANFEVCDGRPPRDRDAKFKYRKPELRGRFPFGAPNEFRFRPWDQNMGGSNELITRTEAGPVTQSPIHVHTMSHTHPAGGHTHSLDPPSQHVHSLNAHNHGLNDHTHPMRGKFVTVNIDEGGGSDFRLLVEETNSKSMQATDPPSPVTTTASASGSTGDSSGSTGSASGSSGGPVPASTGSAEVEGPTHVHDVRIGDTRPAFTEFLFIIRVK